jgi:hypothetical protein
VPRRFDLSFDFSYSSPPPFSPTVGGIDFNGDGTTGDLLPGTTAGAFNRGFSRGDLVRLVDEFNLSYAGKRDMQLQPRIIPRITLPASYAFDHGFRSLDLRLSRAFVLRDRWRLSLIGEVFNLFNFANLSGYSDVVQEFQISTVNFDLSTGLTFTGAINVATRSGGNVPHGSAFYFFRDHRLSAYPALRRDPANQDPFFQRRQFGFAAGGPIRRDRLFLFGNWERIQQRAVATTTLFGPDFAHLSSITSVPLFGDQLSLRMDGRLSGKHTAFLRYSHDNGRTFGPGGLGGSANTHPSNWVRELTWADQSLLGITSVLRPALVNDFRFSYFYVSNDQLAPGVRDCRGCLGIGAPTISVLQTGLVLGPILFT